MIELPLRPALSLHLMPVMSPTETPTQMDLSTAVHHSLGIRRHPVVALKDMISDT